MSTAKAKLSARTENYRNFIGGRWVKPAGGAMLENRNPADVRDRVGLFPASTAEDVEAAVRAAAAALPKWRATPAPKRGEILYRLGQILLERKEQLATDMTREMGKVLKETRGDVQEAIDMTFYAAGEGRRLHGYTTPSELPEKAAWCVRQPIGVCSLITPWNFPMAIPSWKMMPALICGNTLVIKPAEDTPLSTINLVKAAEEAGVPAGVINVVIGTGEAAGAPLVSHPGVRLVSFTGSTETGRLVAEEAGRTGKSCSLEMGGKNVIIVMDDADLELAAEGTTWGAFGTSGQRCTASSRVVVHKRVYKRFVEKLTERARALRIGHGLDRKVDVGPVINEEAVRKILGYIEIGRNEDGATLHLGGRRLERGDHRHGYFIEPTIFTDVKPQMRIAQEEIFGPVVSVIPCRDLDEAIEIGNGVRYGLSSSIYTGQVNRAFRAMEALNTGIFYVNSSTIGAEVHLPFGGTKATGNGHREGAMASSLDIFSEWKAIYVDYSGRLQKAQIDNQ
ncbi:MAG TPA: aldehyde dehydrogenase family protein [Blastocatellia bacterium]|nr:aldehyde dehydrogenase family protein [Blastocatellia bacterium]